MVPATIVIRIMSAPNVILTLTAVGFLLIAAEVFVPGLVLGSLGALCLFGAVLVGYMNFGVLAGTLIFAALSVVTLGGFLVWMFSFPRTAVGRRIMLPTSLTPGDSRPPSSADLLGREGVALTPLRPAGTARIDGRKVDVVAESDFIQSQDAITVILVEGMRVVVRKKIVPTVAA